VDLPDADLKQWALTIMPKFANILFPVDFSERSRAAAPFVLSMAHHYGAKVTLLHAIQPPPPLYAGMNTVYPETFDFTEAQKVLETRLREFADAELPRLEIGCTVEVGDPANTITEFAGVNHIDLIAIPTHGYGVFRRMLLGSVTAKVLHDARIPVWTSAHAPEPTHRAHPKPRHILAALDLKPESRHTLEVALQLAQDSGATVEMVHAAHEGEITPLNPENRLHEVLVEAAREQLVKVHEEAGADVEILTDGNNVAKLVRCLALKKRIDLIVIGRGRIQETFGQLGTNVYSIIREAPCPVLSV
jgi:nucleotide-binding universal stress UspA family protein